MNWDIPKDHIWKAHALQFDLMVTGECIRTFSKGERMWFGCPCLSRVTEAVAEHGEGISGWGLTQPVTLMGGWAPVHIKDQAWPFLDCFFLIWRRLPQVGVGVGRWMSGPFWCLIPHFLWSRGVLWVTNHFKNLGLALKGQLLVTQLNTSQLSILHFMLQAWMIPNNFWNKIILCL